VEEKPLDGPFWIEVYRAKWQGRMQDRYRVVCREPIYGGVCTVADVHGHEMANRSAKANAEMITNALNVAWEKSQATTQEGER
jgi:hypothetical protein